MAVYTMQEAAKRLNCGLGANSLFKELRSRGIFRYVKNGWGKRDNIPNLDYCDKGWFEVKTSSKLVIRGDIVEIRDSYRTFVTEKGLKELRKIFPPTRPDDNEQLGFL